MKKINVKSNKIIKTLNFDNFLKTTNNGTRFLTLLGFLVTPVTTVYDLYIDRAKLTEQKNPVEHIVPPSLSQVG